MDIQVYDNKEHSIGYINAISVDMSDCKDVSKLIVFHVEQSMTCQQAKLVTVNELLGNYTIGKADMQKLCKCIKTVAAKICSKKEGN